ncbi:cleavage and polyadenylation specificity factor subunit 4 [Teleopsis dalmanni]|uniref:cleavage and polyadenylation specificity factor subunit 4 n=1 Tax=Teleopsis dalmanni TaxID=139649 RepID=UPI0018CF4484|nr:cleavage and polyadenylation specificity factor subunit 4 [Teleopsis dalmanni]
MDVILANVNNINFKIEKDLMNQCGALLLPFGGMDKSMAAVCQFLDKTGLECDKGSACPFRHIRGDRTIVCKHWLRGLCKKGDQCEFLHEYDMKKMPECYFYSRFNACHNKECPFLHIDPESKVKDCPWYDRGFCRHGPNCRHRHVRRVLCINYLAGFCFNGWNCKYVHPTFEIPPLADIAKEQMQKKTPICHLCGELGHKASMCRKVQDEDRQFKHNTSAKQYVGNLQNLTNRDFNNDKDEGEENVNTGHSIMTLKISKPIEEVTCYKCGNKGHYANKCPKGHLAFLSNQRNQK